MFYLSNSFPQHQDFNQGIWSQLERHILEGCLQNKERLTVFAGPVNRTSDLEYRGARIPQSFWKIVVAGDPANPRGMKVDGYMMDQYAIGNDGSLLPVEWEPSRAFDPNMYRASVKQIEALTPLLFGNLDRFDTAGNPTE